MTNKAKYRLEIQSSNATLLSYIIKQILNYSHSELTFKLIDQETEFEIKT